MHQVWTLRFWIALFLLGPGLAQADQTLWAARAIPNAYSVPIGETPFLFTAFPTYEEACGAPPGVFSGKTRGYRGGNYLPGDIECTQFLVNEQWRAALVYCKSSETGKVRRGVCDEAPSCQGNGLGTGDISLPDMGGGATSNQTSNPIDLRSGQKLKSVSDWVSDKDARFSIARLYSAEAEVYDMGLAWRSGWDRWLSISGGRAIAARGTNDITNFTLSGPTGTPTRDEVKIRLGQVNSEWHITTGSGIVERYAFDGLSGSHRWRLVGIDWPDGYEMSIQRDAQGDITGLADSRGQSAVVTMANVTPDLRVITRIEIDFDTGSGQGADVRLDYSYETSPNGLARLTGATLSDLSQGVDGSDTPIGETVSLGSYRYATSSGIGERIEAFIDGKGVEYNTVTYDILGQTTSSVLAGGAEAITVSYDSATQRTLTNALGKQSIITLEDHDGIPRIVQVDGVATTHCLGTTVTTDYSPASAGQGTGPDGYVYKRVERNGAVTLYQRDARGLVTQKTEDAEGAAPRITTRAWHGTLRLPTRITTSQLEERFSYDANGLLLSYEQEDVLAGSPSFGAVRQWDFGYQTLASGLQVLDTLDGPGLSASGVTDIVDYDYDTNGVLTRTTSATGLVTDILTTNDRGQPTRIRTPDGVETVFEYDYRGRMTGTVRDVAGGTFRTDYAYDTLGQIVTMTLPRGGVWRYTYDDARRLTEVESPTGDTLHYSYNALGNVTRTEHRSAPGMTTFAFDQEFDELGRILKHIGGNAQVWQFRHDREDNLEEVTDPLGHSVLNAFDPLNRVIRVTDERGEVTAMDHNDADAVTSHTDPRTLVTTTDYNGFGEVVREAGPDDGETTYAYDSRGLVISMVDARLVETTYSYDDDGRVTAIRYPSSPGEDQVFSYGTTGLNAGHLIQVTDGSGQTDRLHNARGLIADETRQIAGRSYQTRYWYDDDGLLESIIYPSGHEIYYNRNLQGEVTRVQHRPSGGTWSDIANSIAWQPFGDRTSLTYGNGVVSTRSYDLSQRLTGQTEAVPLGATLRDVRHEYSLRDNLTRVDDRLNSNQDWDYGYDARQMLALATGPSEQRTYGYDANGNRVQFATFDPLAGALTSLLGTGQSDTLIGTPQRDLIQGLGGQLDALTGGASGDVFDFSGLASNGKRDIARITDYVPGVDALYLGADQIASSIASPGAYILLIESNTAGQPPDMILLQGLTDLAQITFLPSLPTGGTGALTDSYTYALDSNRLTQIAHAGTPARAFTYDNAGNTLTEVHTIGAGTDSWSYAYNAQNRLSSVTLNGAVEASYTYNFAGHQVVRTTDPNGTPETTVTVHDLAGNRIGEYDGATGALLREYIWLEGRPLAVLEGGTLYHLHTDHIDRPVMATGPGGGVVWQASYTPFGAIASVQVDTGALTAQELRFPGQWFQAESGLHQNWHRDYDPTTGRYLQSDPLGLVDGPATYNYARQSPLRHIDQHGKSAIDTNPNSTTILEGGDAHFGPPVVLGGRSSSSGSGFWNACKALISLGATLFSTEACGGGSECFPESSCEEHLEKCRVVDELNVRNQTDWSTQCSACYQRCLGQQGEWPGVRDGSSSRVGNDRCDYWNFRPYRTIRRRGR